MQRVLVSFLFVISAAIPSCLSAQVIESSVCDVLANPKSFDGKFVRIKGVVIAGFEEFAIKDSSCQQGFKSIWLSYPEGAKGKAGPAASLRIRLAKNHPANLANVDRPPVKLERNKEFKNFDSLLATPAKVSGLCLGCGRYSVTATLVGRLDSAQDTGLLRDSSGAVTGVDGFGNLNRYTARLVLQSVSDVSPQEIDYAKGAGALAQDAAPMNGAFTPGAPSADQVKRGADAFGKEGEHNGVDVSFRAANEVPADDGVKSTASSPDGLVFEVAVDGERLKGPTLQIAISHVGTHIADIRSGVSGLQSLSFFGAEFRAWQTSLLNAIAVDARTLTLPGGYAIYDQSWPNSDLGKNANTGIAGFLVNWVGITNPPKS